MNSDVIECDVASWAVTCTACGAIGPVGASTREAMDRWNVAQDTCAAERGEEGRPV